MQRLFSLIAIAFVELIKQQGALDGVRL